MSDLKWFNLRRPRAECGTPHLPRHNSSSAVDMEGPSPDSQIHHQVEDQHEHCDVGDF
jgi:hypothetical protein